MKFSMTVQEKKWPFNTDDCLIKVTTWTGLTVYWFITIELISSYKVVPSTLQLSRHMHWVISCLRKQWYMVETYFVRYIWSGNRPWFISTGEETKIFILWLCLSISVVYRQTIDFSKWILLNLNLKIMMLFAKYLFRSVVSYITCIMYFEIRCSTLMCGFKLPICIKTSGKM